MRLLMGGVRAFVDWRCAVCARLFMGGVRAFVDGRCACVCLCVRFFVCFRYADVYAYVRMFVSGVCGFFIIITKAILASYLPHFPHLMFLSGHHAGLFAVAYVSDDPNERVKHYLVKHEDISSNKTLPDFLREKPQFQICYQVMKAVSQIPFCVSLMSLPALPLLSACCAYLMCMCFTFCFFLSLFVWLFSANYLVFFFLY